MGLSGSWRAANVAPTDFAQPTQWGTGVNPIHSTYAGIPRGAPKLPLGTTGPGDQPPEDILGPVQWGYAAEDAQYYAGEDYRYLALDHPNWGTNLADGGRPDRDGEIFAANLEPQPEGWPAWGPANLDGTSDDFPLSGPPGGLGIRAYSDGEELENAHAIAVPTPGVSGGWLNKQHSEVNAAVTSDQAQYEIATGIVQTSRSLDNNRAVARATDDARSPIANRLTGMKVKDFAQDINMGGGPGTPDMLPQSTDTIPKRPFVFRTAYGPPPEDHTWNEITYFQGINRTVPDPAGSYVATTEAGPPGTYGYTSEDGGYY